MARWQAACANALRNPDITLSEEIRQLLKSGNAGTNKFGAKKVITAEGLKFDSGVEYKHYCELLWREQAGQISNLERQPVFVLTAGVRYIADFRYREDGVTVIVDVKGGKATQTPSFRDKWKQVQVLYPENKYELVVTGKEITKRKR